MGTKATQTKSGSEARLIGHSGGLRRMLTLGLTSVHVNRTLRKLREAGLVTMREGRVEIMDLDGLVKLAEFDPAYLDQTGPLLM
ncbi:helix-turn-helix domain-containing protein [Loktanella sp. M215]|nr:helix-turn-helix domain-containing protein [Loktanella sp. M215]